MQHGQHGAAPSVVEYAGGSPDVPMQQLDATPAVPPGMSSQTGAPPVAPREVGDLEAAARALDVSDVSAEKPPPIEQVQREAVRRTEPPGLSAAPTAQRTAQMNVAAHRRMGLRTQNQQDRFDNSALLGQQRPARIAGVQPPPFMQGGTMQIRQDLPPRGRGGRPPGSQPSGGGFGPVKKPRGERWGDTGRDPLMRALVDRRRQQQWEERPAHQAAIRQSISDEEKRQEAQRRRQGPYPGARRRRTECPRLAAVKTRTNASL